MSYLRRLATETRTRFQPRRSRSFAFENTLRVEESFVEAPPPQSAEPRAKAPHVEAQSAMVPDKAAPAMKIDRVREIAPHPTDRLIRPRVELSEQRPRTIDAEPEEAQRRAHVAAMEVRRELPNAIEESMVFDSGEIPPVHVAAREPHRPQAKTANEALDPKQAESGLARVRALTGQRHRIAQPPVPAAAKAGTQQPLLKEPEQIAATRPAETPRPSPIRAMHVADTKEPVANATEKDIVKVSFGSIVVHVEPEAVPAPQAPQPARQRTSVHSAAEADNRWMRSFLDRN